MVARRSTQTNTSGKPSWSHGLIDEGEEAAHCCTSTEPGAACDVCLTPLDLLRRQLRLYFSTIPRKYTLLGEPERLSTD